MGSDDRSPMNLDVIDYVRREKMVLLNLTDQERRFCEEYVRHFDRKIAYADAGYDTRGFSTDEEIKGLEEEIDALIQKSNVAAYLLLLRESVASRIGVSLDMIVEEYRRMAFAKMEDFVSWSAAGVTFLRPSDQLTLAQRAAVMEITETETKAGKTVKIKLFPKQAALDRLFEILKEMEDRQEKPRVNKIDQTQINFILGDSVKRRAIEHLASGMFNRQVMLVENDEEAMVFNEHIKQITEKFQGVARGSRRGGVGAPAIHAAAEGAGRPGTNKDKRSSGRPKKAEVGGLLPATVEGVRKGGPAGGHFAETVGRQENGENFGDAEIAESERYSDIPGL